MKNKSFPLAAAALLTSAVSTANVSAAELQINITNLTQGMYFTPRLVVAHTDALALFELGTVASPELANLAEGGVIGENGDADTFATLLESDGVADLNVWQSFGGLVEPATTSVNYSFDSEDFEYLSMASMLVPTNDAFVGLNSWKIPTEPGTYTIYLNAYDSGSEANSETVADMATPPPTQPLLGTGGTGVSADAEGMVHVHRNALGDTDAEGGISDLDATVHRWLNPVAKVVVTVPAPVTAE